MAEKKRKTTKPQTTADTRTTAEILADMDEHIRMGRELAERGWAELEAKYAAEGRELPVRGPHR